MNVSESTLPTLLASDLFRYYPDLVAFYQQRLFAFAYRLTACHQDAEDIVQEALVEAYVSLENYPPQRIQTLKLRPWLYRVTFNTYTHSIRGARLHLISLEFSDESPALTIEDKQEERPEAIFESLERRAELGALVAQLPERYRIALTCYYFEQMSYQETAELLDQPIGTVKSTVSRAIRLLRALIASPQPHEREDSVWTSIRSRNNKA